MTYTWLKPCWDDQAEFQISSQKKSVSLTHNRIPLTHFIVDSLIGTRLIGLYKSLLITTGSSSSQDMCKCSLMKQIFEYHCGLNLGLIKETVERS